MRSLITMAIAAVAAADTVIMPPTATSGQDIAIVWIQGASCPNESYKEIAASVQAQGAKSGQKVWIGIPEFLGNTPEPLRIGADFNDTIKQLRDAGFTGDNILIAGHSLGGVMAQNYAKDHKDVIKGQVLMGSVLTRGKRDIKADGTTHYNYDVPTLTIGGTKDGLMRVSRIAESYWHSYNNIEDAQKNLFPVVALDGVSHMGFMSGEAPKAVAERDLVMDVSEANAHQDVATVMVQFMDQIIMGHQPSIDTKSTQTILAPLLEAMELEGFYGMK